MIASYEHCLSSQGKYFSALVNAWFAVLYTLLAPGAGGRQFKSTRHWH
jgi:hypothetical protein